LAVNDSDRTGIARSALLPWLLVAAGLLAYANSLTGPFLYDDALAIVDNPSIRQLWPPGPVVRPPTDTPVAGRPVVNVTLAANYGAGGLDVRGYHAVNLAIHLVGALLVYGIVRRTLSGPRLVDRFGGASAGVAAAAALLWTVHPLQTECVNYVTQRSESLMALLYLLTMYCAIRAGGGRRAPAWHVASVLACALGMATKESMVTAPIMVVLYDWAYRDEPWRHLLRRRAGLYAGLAATWAVLAWLMAGGPRSATVGFGLGIGAWEYLLNQCAAVTVYLKLIVWPDPLVLDYGFPLPLSLADVLSQALLLAGVALLAAVLLVRRHPAGYPLAWLLVTLAPTSSVVPIVTEVAAERRMYLPLAGAAALAVSAAWLLVARVPAERWAVRPRAAGAGLVALVALSLTAVTWRRNALYRDPVALWQATVEAVPDNHRAHTNLGAALVAAGRLDEAIERFELALRVKPETPHTGLNLANALAAKGRDEQAHAMATDALAWAEDAGDAALAADIRARFALYAAADPD
jgi:hypothetical protein